jgi:hypothetical protein
VAWHPHQNEIVTSSWDGKTHLWRYDEREQHSINPDSSAIGDENSCDENYEPVRLRLLKNRQQLGRGNKSQTGFDFAGQSSAISSTARYVKGLSQVKSLLIFKTLCFRKSNKQSDGEPSEEDDEEQDEMIT